MEIECVMGEEAAYVVHIQVIQMSLRQCLHKNANYKKIHSICMVVSCWHVNHLSANSISSPSSGMLSACHLSIVYTGYGGESSLMRLAIFKCMTLEFISNKKYPSV